MRIAPNHPRLRVIALFCWAIGAWWMLQPGVFGVLRIPPILVASSIILASIILAVGVAFWLLGTDRRAGISFDSKGLMLNLGHSASFVAWENIAGIGVSQRYISLLALGSPGQIGMRLHDPAAYLQSYEVRLPASRGLLARAIRAIERLARRSGAPREPTLESIHDLRQRTGYDILIPEALLGGSARAFVTLLESYKVSPEQRRSLPLGIVISRA